MLIRHVMARDPRSIAPEKLCRDAYQLFQTERIRHAPVVEEGRLVGVVSERDLTRALPGTIGALEGEAAGSHVGTRVGAVMARRPITCGPNDPIDLVALRLEERKIGCMPVVDGHRLLGIVTATDLLRGFAEHAGQVDAWPVTLLWDQGHADAPPDIAALCVQGELRLQALFQGEAGSGARVFLLRLQGEDVRLTRFLSMCRDAGFGVLSSRAAA